MLFNPTPMEKLGNLTNDLIAKYNAAKEELEGLRQEITSIRANGNGIV